MKDNIFTISNINFINDDFIEKFTLETTILFQLKGITNVYIDGKIHNMSKGNLMIINRNKNYALKNNDSKENILINFKIDNSYFISLYEEFHNSTFELFPYEETAGKASSIDILRTEMSKFLINYSNPSKTKNINLNISINQIILSLVSYFKKEIDFQESVLKNEKIIDILKYIDKNYNKKITIESLASRYYMSPSTLSKTFKEETGKLFSKYLNDLRSTKSLKDLLYSSLSIEEIAFNNGFGNSRTYRRSFKETFNNTPSEYRKKNNLENNIEDSHNFIDILDKSSDIFETLYSFINAPKKVMKNDYIIENNKKLILDSTIDRQQIHPNMLIHIGSLDLLLEKDTFKEFATTVKEIGVNYIGISSVYLSYPISYLNINIDNRYVFSDYGKFDYLLDYIKKEGINFFYQVSLSDISNGKNKNFLQLLNFIKYIKEIYTDVDLKQFRVNFIIDKNNIEIENNTFKLCCQEIKSISNNIEIGMTIPFKYPKYSFNNKADEKIYLNEILPICNFLSYTSDPNIIYNYGDNKIVDMDFFNEFVYKEINKIKNIVSHWNSSMPLVLTEWNTLTGESESLNGAFFRSGIIVKEILKLDLIIESYGFWLNAGIYRNMKFDKSNKYTSLELFHNYYGKKPVYNVLVLLARLKGNVRFLGEECMLLQEGEQYQFLLWNPNYFNPKLSEQIKFIESKAAVFNVDIPCIKDGNYQIKRFDLSRYQGAVFYVFQNFKSKIPIDIESRKYIANEANPKLSVFDIEVKEGFKYSITMDTNAIVLLEFKPY